MKLRDFLFLIRKTLRVDKETLKTKTLASSEDYEREEKIYRLVIINEKSMKESFSSIITRRKVFVFFVAMFLFNCIAWYLVYAYTPFKFILPEKGSYVEKKEWLALRKKTDSLEQQYKYNEAMIQKFKSYFLIEPRNEELKYQDSIRR